METEKTSSEKPISLINDEESIMEATKDLYGIKKQGITEHIMQELYDNNMYNYHGFNKDMFLTQEQIEAKKGELFFDNEIITNVADVSYQGNQRPMLGGQNTRWITFNIRQLDILTRSNPHIRNAINFLSTLPLMNGIDINSPEDKITSQEMFIVNKKFDTLYRGLKDSLNKHYSYGGSAALMWFENQTLDELKDPLLPSKIRKGSFMGLKTLARWYSIEPALEKGMITYVGDNNGIYNADYIGTPEYYWVHLVGGLYGLDGAANQKGRILVHVSRLLMFNTEMPSVIETQIERFWGASLVEKIYNDLINDRRLWNATLKSADKNNLGVLKIKGLGLTATSSSRAKKQVEARIGLIKEASSNNVLPIDENDTFEFAQAALSGQSQIMEISHSRLAGAAGVSTNAMFSYGDDKNENIAVKDIIKSKDTQERLLRPAYEKLLPVIIKSELGKQIKDVVFTFNPIETLTLKDKTNMFLDIAQSLEILYEIGLDKASIMGMLDDVGKDPINIAQNINAEFREHIIAKAKKGEFETRNSDQILVAETLNQQKNLAGVYNPESDLGGDLGGNKKQQKRPLERHSLNREKAKL